MIRPQRSKKEIIIRYGVTERQIRNPEENKIRTNNNTKAANSAAFVFYISDYTFPNKLLKF